MEKVISIEDYKRKKKWSRFTLDKEDKMLNVGVIIGSIITFSVGSLLLAVFYDALIGHYLNGESFSYLAAITILTALMTYGFLYFLVRTVYTLFQKKKTNDQYSFIMGVRIIGMLILVLALLISLSVSENSFIALSIAISSFILLAAMIYLEIKIALKIRKKRKSLSAS